MTLTTAGLTQVGRRTNNEDALLNDPTLALFIVADGMGGYEGGEVASALAVEAMRCFVADNLRDPEGTWPIRAHASRSYDENLLGAAAVAAHQAIVRHRTERLSRMGSTMVAALVRENHLVFANVGDSRLYRVRQGTVTQLSKDHSYWAELNAAGFGGDRAAFAYKNQITRALGIDNACAADVSLVSVESGDTYLLCSDGLYDPLDDATMASALSLEPVAACERLVDAAFERGSTDNITAVVFRVTRPPS